MNLDRKANDDEIKADVRNANAVTVALLARSKKATENTLVSGTSVRQALGATYLGARGPTAKEMASALDLDSDVEIAASLARAELEAWQSARGDAELSVANRLWVDDDFVVMPDFLKAAEAGFGASPASVDYAKPEEARREINAWVAEKTKDKIPELLPQGSVEPTTRLIVTNAIWFKGRWQFPFQKSATKDEPFKVDAQKSVSVPSMHLTDTFRISVDGGVKVLEMSYADSKLAMLIVLPDDPQPSALTKLEANLTADTLERWVSSLRTAQVKVSLPRFTFRGGGPMASSLQDMGMKLAFTEKADFGGIAKPRANEPLYIDQVFHQTWIAVDELGTEAAAATGVTMRTTSLVTGPPVEFKADRPFLFFIRESAQGRLLFAGRVMNPKT